MKDKLYKKLFKEQKAKSPKQVIAEMILRRQCDHKREGKKGEKPNWETYNVTENGEAKTMAVCSNPLCACSKKKDAICLDPLDPEEIREHAKYMINVFEVLKINNQDSDEDFLNLMATLIVYLELSPDMYKANVLDRLSENGIMPDDDDDDDDSTGPKWLKSDKSFGFDDKKDKKKKNWKKKKDKDKKKKKKKNKGRW